MTARMPEHGSTARYRRNCLCGPCTNAIRIAEGRRNLLIASGRWPPFTDPAPVRAHIQALLDTGMTWRNLSEAAGAHKNTLARIHRGHYVKVRTEIAAAILAIPVDRAAPARYLVDATGTRRRLQALYRREFTTAVLCAQLHTDPAHVLLLARGTRLVTRDTRARVATAFKALHAQDPAVFGVSAAERRRVRAFADHNGFAPAGAWNDIDDPDEAPDLGESSPRLLAVVEDAEFIRATVGATDEQIADRLQVPKSTLQTMLARARRRERVAA